MIELEDILEDVENNKKYIVLETENGFGVFEIGENGVFDIPISGFSKEISNVFGHSFFSGTSLRRHSTKSERALSGSLNEYKNLWVNSLCNLTSSGKDFFSESGEFSFSFKGNGEIFNIHLQRKPDNIIPFPSKK